MNLAKIQLEEISEHIDPYAIKNFIISDRSVYLPPVSSNFPFVIDGIVFSICIQGSARVRINFREYVIEKNTIITVLPFYVVEYITRSDDLLVEFLVFSMDFMTEMPKASNIDISRSILQSSCLEISEEEADRYLEFHSFIVKQYKRRDHPFRPAMAKGLLYALLTEIGAIYYNKYLEDSTFNEPSPNSHQEELVARFFKLLLEHHKTEKTLQFYADKMFLTPKYLSTVVKERTGRTAFAWINEALISSTKHMLKTTNMTVLQISEELNFPNPSFFGRFFKKHTGMTPLQYKES
jgi:AraC-like DNA-binding protein